jgi:8-oxo-dGTP diphosphatase
MPLAQALKRVSYKQDVSVLSDFAARPADTVPLILLRHARALARSEWGKDDAERPLDRAGTADAAGLASLLSCFAPEAEVISSPAARCLDTIKPYAELSGSKIQVEASLATPAFGQAWPAPGAIHHGIADSAAGNYALVSALVAAETPAIICAHRENLPALLDVALTTADAVAPDRAVTDGARVPEAVTRPLPKGAFLVLHLAAGTLAGIDRYELG